jgi:hypothetical protein
MFKAAGLGHEAAIEWVNQNYPDQPDWLINLKKSAQEVPEGNLEAAKTSDDPDRNTDKLKPNNSSAKDDSE